ncbi:unnamed protein product [Soboliphyme baturini]|uniref:Ovule protein n=1 Tax=Soboliphyme baturini TaxID=241478 RepID=A0A183J2T6_9BILA|nr:unnamed protein product [Soboliphyme baturini]
MELQSSSNTGLFGKKHEKTTPLTRKSEVSRRCSTIVDISGVTKDRSRKSLECHSKQPFTFDRL